MFLGLGVRFALLGSASAPPFDFATFFTAGEPGAWYDPSDLTTLFQDSAGTTPVTTPGQPVELVLDKSGRGNHATQTTAGSRPTYGVHPSSGYRNIANGSAAPGGSDWLSSSTASGITVTRVASGFDTDGLPYVDYSVVGTATANTFPTPYNTASRFPAKVGQQYTTSCTVSLVSGTPPPANCGVRLDVRGETAPSTLTEQFTTGTAVTSGNLSVSGTFVNAATNQSAAAVIIRVGNGNTVNFTVRIKGLQFELGAARTAYQFNYSKFNVTEPPFSQLSFLSFDGSDDFLITPTITPGTDTVQVFAGVRKLSDAARGMVVELGIGGAASFYVAAPNFAGTNYTFNSGGSIANAATAQTDAVAAPDTSVLSGQAKISTDVALLRRNGSQVASDTTDQGTGNYSADIIYIGRRGGTTLPFNGFLYGLTVRFGPTLNDTDISRAESWLGTKAGVTIA